MVEKYITEEKFEKGIQRVVDELSDVMNSMMDRIDERFAKVETDISDVKDRMTRLEESHDRLVNTIDGFVKRIEDYEVESRVRDAQFERLTLWAKEVSKKTGIPLPQL